MLLRLTNPAKSLRNYLVSSYSIFYKRSCSNTLCSLYFCL